MLPNANTWQISPRGTLFFEEFLAALVAYPGTRTRTNTNPNGTEANAAGRSGNARALRKQSKCGMIQEGEGHWPNSSKNLPKARNLWVLRTPQNNKEEAELLCFLFLPVSC